MDSAVSVRCDRGSNGKITSFRSGEQLSIETLRCIIDSILESAERKDLAAFVLDGMDVNSAAAQMPRCEVVNVASSDEEPCNALAVSMVPGGRVVFSTGPHGSGDLIVVLIV